ncbi:MAG: cysteinyl-tRNA synthetase, partial [Arcticibacterium sp.]
DVEIDEKKKQILEKAMEGFYGAMGDDLNTAVGIAHLFTMLKYVNMIFTNQLSSAVLGEITFSALKENFAIFFEDILGLKEESKGPDTSILEGMLDLYREYKENRNFDKVDQIRAYFKDNDMVIKDLKHTIDWAWIE